MSQITKPMALDETLQDVVTAIQGITQGGMIVSTGTVGSSTQPVYINGGVPTAGMNFAITTGTPTNINSNCSLRSGDIVKSGNVVNLRIALTINTTFTPSSSTTLFKLPWTPALTYPQFDRVLEDSGSFYELGKSYADGANIACGKASNYGVFTAGRIITINGTYITSD